MAFIFFYLNSLIFSNINEVYFILIAVDNTVLLLPFATCLII